MKIKYINRATGKVETENPPAEGLMKFLYGNTFGKWAILPFAKQKIISSRYGKMMESPKSVERIQPFIDALKINMDEAKKTVSEFKNFNEFFFRELKEGARPIEQGMVSPGDGRVLAFEKASQVNDFFIKGNRFTLSSYLKDDADHEKYKDASMIIIRLAPNDYHRYHFPFKGIASSIRRVGTAYYSVSPIALAENFTKVFTENVREFCTLKTENHGDIMVSPVGATMVGSLNNTFIANSAIEKGDEMGYFAFGGSTVVLLFDPNKFQISQDLLDNTRNNMETYLKMGEQIALEK